jgi:hypothetical protein
MNARMHEFKNWSLVIRHWSLENCYPDDRRDLHIRTDSSSSYNQIFVLANEVEEIKLMKQSLSLPHYSQQTCPKLRHSFIHAFPHFLIHALFFRIFLQNVSHFEPWTTTDV